MYGLTWRASDGADRKGFWRFLRIAVVAFSLAFDNDLYLPIEAGSATLDQGHIGREAHLVDMSSCIEIV